MSTRFFPLYRARPCALSPALATSPGRRTRLWLCLVFAAWAGGAAAGAPPLPAQSTVTPEQQFQVGLEAQSQRDYAAMLAQLRQAAARGNVEAQEMLGLVLLVGPTLYGPAVRADRCEAGQWLRRAADQGSLVGVAQLHFLSRLRQAPDGVEVCAGSGN